MTGTVLVVEDDEPTATLIRDVLEAQGYTVLHAIDGASLAVASREHPDAILLDINMPDMSGPEADPK